MTKAELGAAIYRVAHLKGDFLLRSGQRSSVYFDKYRFESEPMLLRSIAENLVPLIPPGVDMFAGLEMGGIPIATALSLYTGIPVIFVRKEAKTYGTCKIAEGMDISGKRLCLIEDVITTGGQVVLSAKELRAQGARIENVLCVIDRSEGKSSALKENYLKLNPLFTMAELLP